MTSIASRLSVQVASVIASRPWCDCHPPTSHSAFAATTHLQAMNALSAASGLKSLPSSATGWCAKVVQRRTHPKLAAVQGPEPKARRGDNCGPSRTVSGSADDHSREAPRRGRRVAGTTTPAAHHARASKKIRRGDVRVHACGEQQ